MVNINNSQCIQCKYLDEEPSTLKCKAFPDGIPEDILSNEFVHSKKYPDQSNDILFEPVEMSGTSITDTQLESIISSLKENQLPDEGNIMIKVGDDLVPVEFRAGRDIRGLFIKTRQNLLSGWVTAYYGESLFTESIRALIDQGLMNKPD